MKLKDVIRYVDDIKPNAFSDDTKTKWINEVEGMVQSEIFLFAPKTFFVYEYERDKDKQLLVHPPHDKLYESYLCAKIDYANGEYDKYQNTMTVFNAEYREFAQWFVTKYRPADLLTRKEFK